MNKRSQKLFFKIKFEKKEMQPKRKKRKKREKKKKCTVLKEMIERF